MAVQVEQPIWLRHLGDDAGLVDGLITWIQAPTWEASQDSLATHAPDLLSDPGEAAMEHLIDANPGVQVLTLHLALLQAARSDGIEAAYEQLRRELDHEEPTGSF
jgi:hypothetical protein